MASTRGMYAIPERFRRIENLHIVFWLLKDMSWALLWKPLGLIMIPPTLTLAALITWQTRKIQAELFHNLAVLFWIFANCFWMVLEFLETPDEYRYFTAIPFGMGILSIAWYYLIILRREKKETKLVRMEIDVPSSIAKAVEKRS
ncbi:MAG TPA: hypothetical protein VIK80_12405 [Flavihumibacter sp.]